MGIIFCGLFLLSGGFLHFPFPWKFSFSRGTVQRPTGSLALAFASFLNLVLKYGRLSQRHLATVHLAPPACSATFWAIRNTNKNGNELTETDWAAIDGGFLFLYSSRQGFVFLSPCTVRSLIYSLFLFAGISARKKWCETFFLLQLSFLSFRSVCALYHFFPTLDRSLSEQKRHLFSPYLVSGRPKNAFSPLPISPARIWRPLPDISRRFCFLASFFRVSFLARPPWERSERARAVSERATSRETELLLLSSRA